MGALLPQKQVDLLIRAYARIRSGFPDVALVIVGDGSHREELEEIVEHLSVEDVTFVARVEGSTPYFTMADLFVLPGFGDLALHQAMAFENPVICSEADGTERDLVIEGVNGHIVKPGDAEELAGAIEDLITDGERFKKMGRESFKIMREKFNFQNMVCEFSRGVHFVCR